MLGEARGFDVGGLSQRLGLEAQVFGQMETPLKSPTVSRHAYPPILPVPLGRPRTYDGSRTRFESSLRFGDVDQGESEEIIPLTGQFTVWEARSGLPDASRAEDGRNGRIALGGHLPQGQREMARGNPRLPQVGPRCKCKPQGESTQKGFFAWLGCSRACKQRPRP